MNWTLFFLIPLAVLVGVSLGAALAIGLCRFSSVPVGIERLATLPRVLFKLWAFMTAALLGIHLLFFFTAAGSLAA